MDFYSVFYLSLLAIVLKIILRVEIGRNSFHVLNTFLLKNEAFCVFKENEKQIPKFCNKGNTTVFSNTSFACYHTISVKKKSRRAEYQSDTTSTSGTLRPKPYAGCARSCIKTGARPLASGGNYSRPPTTGVRRRSTTAADAAHFCSPLPRGRAESRRG